MLASLPNESGGGTHSAGKRGRVGADSTQSGGDGIEGEGHLR